MNIADKDLVDEICDGHWFTLTKEMEKDKSPEFRRGFYAGCLVASLSMRNVVLGVDNYEHE